MWRSKKMIISLVLASVLLLGSLGGIALAADDEEDSQPGAFLGTLWEKVSALYEQKTGDTLDQDALKEAFADARTDMCKDRAEMRAAAMGNRPEVGPEAMQERLQKMIADGIIDEAQAEELQEWWDSKPEDVPFGPGLNGPGGFRGMRGYGGMFGPPPELAE